MFLSQQFGDHGRDTGKDRPTPEAPETAPTHLLTMTRGAAEAVPERLISALHAMGIPARMLPGRGLGLVLAETVPEFLQRDPFCVTPLEAEAPAAAESPGEEMQAEVPEPPTLEEPPLEPPAPEPATFDPPVEPEPESAEAPVPEEEAPEDGTDPEDDGPGLMADKADRILERLELIEFLISEEKAAPEEAAAPGSLDDRLGRMEESLARVQSGEAALSEGMARLEGLCQRVETAIGQLASRPAPALDLTTQQRGFAAFGTAMATLQTRLDAAAARMEGSQAALLAEVAALLARPATGGGVELEALSSLVAVLSDQLAAAHRPAPQVDLGPVLDSLRQTQERVAATLAQMQELPDTRMQAAQEDFLRAVRLIIAELLADHRRANGS